MNSLHAIIKRPMPPAPWAEGDNIPWNEPAFSKRMLVEHLTQEHDLASRVTGTIDTQVSWIHSSVLHERPSRVLDLVLESGPASWIRYTSGGATGIGVHGGWGGTSCVWALDQGVGFNSRLRTADSPTFNDVTNVVYPFPDAVSVGGSGPPGPPLKPKRPPKSTYPWNALLQSNICSTNLSFQRRRTLV